MITKAKTERNVFPVSNSEDVGEVVMRAKLDPKIAQTRDSSDGPRASLPGATAESVLCVPVDTAKTSMRKGSILKRKKKANAIDDLFLALDGMTEPPKDLTQ